MTYLWLKAVHVHAVYLSGALFALRGTGMLCGAGWQHRGLWRVLPHLVDTLLLAAAIGLVVVLGQYPFTHHWLSAKVLALCAYIVLGSVALKRGRTPRIRVLAFCAAILTFAYMLGVAYQRHPLSWLQLVT
jgi:uncharacterized membrane protein SirB2